MAKKPTVSPDLPVGIVVPHTHWDREWRYPIWKNRALLVKLMDSLLDVLEKDPAYSGFVMDGQCIVIHDYLQMRPENTARVKKQVKKGRLAIGPWYTLPDLFPIDGECLVRNLLVGTRISAQLGGCLDVGYNSFGWGQTAQFPQIYAGFGIKNIIAAKTVSRHRAKKCEYWWEGPDGTRALTTRLGQHARANGFFNMYIQTRFGIDVRGNDEYWLRWGQGGTIVHTANVAEAYKDYFRVDHLAGYHKDNLKNGLEAMWKAVDDTALPDWRLLMTGSDSTGPQHELPRIVRDGNALFPDRHLEMGSLSQWFAKARELIAKKKIELDVVQGELRDGPPESTSANALATRIHIKILNKQAENTLLRQAEPMASSLELMGWQAPQSFIDLAWDYLLKSHPHDSINGVTQDKTVEDTLTNLGQALELAGVVRDEAAAELIRRIDLSSYSPSDVLLVIANPLATPTRAIVKVAIDTPQSENAWDIAAVDADNQPLRLQHVGRQERTSPVNDLHARPWPYQSDRHLAWLDTGEIPAGGFKVAKVVKTDTFFRLAEFWSKTPWATGTDIAVTPHHLETQQLRVDVNSDGTFNLLDKASGRQYANLGWLEDTGDIGDYWIYYAPRENRTYSSLGQVARVWLEDNGPLAATVAIEVRMLLPTHATRPDNYIRGESRRQDALEEITVTTRLTLKADSRRVELHTVVNNTVRDHRLRIMFPTMHQSDAIDAAGHFNVDRRAASPVDPDGKTYRGMQTLPMQYFVDASDSQGGLAVLNNCFTEYQAVGTPTTLALTLFRAVKNIICTEYRSAGVFEDQPGGQLLQKMEFRYALLPHDGNWAAADLFNEAARFNVEPLVTQTFAQGTPAPVPGNSSDKADPRGDLPAAGVSLMALEGSGLVLSAFKKAADRNTHIARVFNPTGDTVKGTLRTYAPLSGAWLTTLNEEREKALKVTGKKAVAFTAAPGKIVTIEIEAAK